MKKTEENSLFPDLELERKTNVAQVKAKERREARKNKNFGIEYCTGAKFCGKYGIPQIKAYKGDLPERFITFSEVTERGGTSVGVVCCDFDYELECLWDNPGNYVLTLAGYKCFAEPDFSIRVGDPKSVQIANTYRNHAVAYFMQEHGVNVMPAPSWSSTTSYEYCFDGYERGGAVLVSTVGVLKDERSLMYFRIGFSEMLKRLSPDCVILYGDVNDDVLRFLPSQLDVHFVSHERYNRMRGNEGER